MHERDMMLLSQHPFILQLVATFKDRYRLFMLLEFVQGGELFNVVHTSARDGVPLDHARFYAAVVTSAFGYLSANSIAYRDLKPENLMVDTSGYLKVVDFGFAKVGESTPPLPSRNVSLSDVAVGFAKGRQGQDVHALRHA